MKKNSFIKHLSAYTGPICNDTETHKNDISEVARLRLGSMRCDDVTKILT